MKVTSTAWRVGGAPREMVVRMQFCVKINTRILLGFGKFVKAIVCQLQGTRGR